MSKTNCPTTLKEISKAFQDVKNCEKKKSKTFSIGDLFQTTTPDLHQIFVPLFLRGQSHQKTIFIKFTTLILERDLKEALQSMGPMNTPGLKLYNLRVAQISNMSPTQVWALTEALHTKPPKKMFYDKWDSLCMLVFFPRSIAPQSTIECNLTKSRSTIS